MPPGVQGHQAGVPTIVLKFMCLLVFPGQSLSGWIQRAQPEGVCIQLGLLSHLASRLSGGAPKMGGFGVGAKKFMLKILALD